MAYPIFDDTMVELNWIQVKKLIDDGCIALLPTAVIEEHGPHMSLGVDTYLSCMLSKLVKSDLEKAGLSTLIAPPYYWGINQVTSAFPGSFSLKPDTMKAVLKDILSSMSSWGLKYVFIINWHEDYQHIKSLIEGIDEAGREKHPHAYTMISESTASRFRFSGDMNSILIYSDPPPVSLGTALDIHAGAFETGLMAEHFPSEVDTVCADRLNETNLTMEDFLLWRKGGEHALKITPLGYLGNPKDYNLSSFKEAAGSLKEAISKRIINFMNG